MGPYNPFNPDGFDGLDGLGLDNTSGIWTPGLIIGVVFAGLFTYYAVVPEEGTPEDAKRARARLRAPERLNRIQRHRGAARNR